ncbi:unnamed protein product, partial [Mesorhabditis belari]|uniref:Clc-like protein 2 n=1 Tax=Mesorhabditis belari TaxID=2138241 RepID=A0AAF3EE51_9BILA
MPPEKLNLLLLQIPTLALAICGFLLVWVSLATPAWQVTYAREIQQWVQSGLWMNCQTRPAGMYTCTYTFSSYDYDFMSAELVNQRTPPFYLWQRVLLHIYLGAQLTVLLAFISFCVSNSHSTSRKCSTVLFSALLGIATLICAGCLLVFSAFAHMVKYRFYTVSVSGIYDKHHGYSFYLNLVGTIFYFLAFVLSLLYVFKALRGDRYGYAGSSLHTITGYRSDDYRLTNEDLFAMRPLPHPPKSRY